MLELLKKAMNIFDLLILAAAAFLLMRFDFSNLTTSNIVYLVVFALWVVMLLVRIFIVYKTGGKK